MEKGETKASASRRDFLKRVGGTAAAAAIISNKLFRLDSAEAAQGGNRKVPDAINNTDFKTLKGYLQAICNEAKAQDVIMRLNRSDATGPRPVFVGWVEDKGTPVSLYITKNNKELILDIGLLRLFEEDDSAAYKEIFTETVSGKDFTEKNWSKAKTGTKNLVPNAKLAYQRYAGIRVNKKCVGSLSVVFRQKPPALAPIDDTLKKWAHEPKSELVQYLNSNFDLGGQTIK